METTRGVRRVIQADREVEGAQGITRDIGDLTLQERAQRTVHREAAGITISQVHSCSQHGYGQLTTLLLTHRHQFIV